MKKEARVLIVEDDPFARSWMALLVARDWRTRVVGEVGGLEEMRQAYAALPEPPDLLVVSAGILTHPFEPHGGRLRAALDGLRGHPLVLLVGKSAAELAALHAAETRPGPFPALAGMLVKGEVGVSLGWAMALCEREQVIITPGLETYLRALTGAHPGLVVDGRRPPHNLTDHEAEVARLALIFSMERRELSDEIKVSADWSYGLVSAIYRKLGMEEILSGEVDAAEYLGKQFAQNPRFREVLAHAGGLKKKNDLETLAFHLLTMPEIREL